MTAVPLRTNILALKANPHALRAIAFYFTVVVISVLQFTSTGKHFRGTQALAGPQPGDAWRPWPHSAGPKQTGYSSGEHADDTHGGVLRRPLKGMGTQWRLQKKTMGKLNTFATSSCSRRPFFFGWKTSETHLWDVVLYHVRSLRYQHIAEEL